MQRFTNRATRSLFGLATAAALIFGGTTAFAQAASAGACPDDGWSTNAGYCPSEEGCALKCQGRWFATGTCISDPVNGPCCVCLG
jgi:hypothetical protein